MDQDAERLDLREKGSRIYVEIGGGSRNLKSSCSCHRGSGRSFSSRHRYECGRPTVNYRIDQLEKKVDAYEKAKDHLCGLEEKVEALQEQVHAECGIERDDSRRKKERK